MKLTKNRTRSLPVIALLTLLAIFASACSTAQTPTAAPSEAAPVVESTVAEADPTEAAVVPTQTAVEPTVEPITIKIGASPVPHAEILTFIKDNLAAAAGLNLEIIEFTDYVQPNLALAEGNIDANFFQHVPYQDDFAKEHDLNLTAAVAVHIEPLGAYSKKIASVDELEDGAVVAIPNDATNSGRALRLLAANGLITLKADAPLNATVVDIAENPKNLQFSELEAAQLPRSLDDTALSVINGNYALEAGLSPSKDALFLESGVDNPYANVLTVVTGHETDPGIQILIKLLTSPEVKQFIEEKYQGAVIPAF